MLTDPLLVERIYEAAALPDRWPGVLQEIADGAGAFGSVLIARSPTAVSMVASTKGEQMANEFVAEGWAADASYTAPLLAEHYPGFRAETAYRTMDEIQCLPVHRDFYAPRGLVAGVGTVIQGAGDDVIQLAVEGFPSHEAAEKAVSLLDPLRGALARSLSLTTRIRDADAGAAVSYLGMAGVGAAVISADGRLRAVNARFSDRLGGGMSDGPGGLRFADRFLQAQFVQALAAISAGTGARSIAMAADADRPASALHLLPLKRGARDVFGWDGVLILLADAANASVPGADLLRLLFDLTPTEARLARLLVEGRAPAEAAVALRIAEATARTHLRRIFAKTGVRRQSELVRLLLGIAAPG